MKRLASIVLVVSLLILGSLGTCAAAEAAGGTLLFGGKITAVDKYGNSMTDISQATVAASGAEVGDIVVVKIGENELVVPFVTIYGDVDRGTPLLRVTGGSVQLAINYGNFSTKYGVSAGTEVSVYLRAKGTYLSEIEICNATKLETREDYSSDAAMANSRAALTFAVKSFAAKSTPIPTAITFPLSFRPR